MYLLPEAEIHCHYVSQKIIQNIKFGLYTRDMSGARRMRSCKIGNNGVIHYFEGEEAPSADILLTHQSLTQYY